MAHGCFYESDVPSATHIPAPASSLICLRLPCWKTSPGRCAMGIQDLREALVSNTFDRRMGRKGEEPDE